MKIIKEFRQFAFRGNMIDLAIGFTVGAAFTTIARSLVDDIIMPPISLLTGHVNFNDMFIVLRDTSDAVPYESLEQARQAGAITLNYGNFLSSILTLLVVAIAMFFIIKIINRVDKRLEQQFGKQDKPGENEPTEKKCEFCLSTIPYNAIRCPQCTSSLKNDKSQNTK